MIKLSHRVRGLFAGNYPENREDEQLLVNNRGDVLQVQGLPWLTETVRLGDSWQTKTTTGTAALTSFPTTTPGLCLWNGEPTGLMGKCYVIDSVAVDVRVVDGTQSGSIALFAMLNKPPIGAPTDLALAIASSMGKTYGGRARTFITTVVDDGWMPCGSTPPVGATTLTNSVFKTQDVYLGGLYIVPPGSAFSIQACQVGSGALSCFFTIRWHEMGLLWKS